MISILAYDWSIQITWDVTWILASDWSCQCQLRVSGLIMDSWPISVSIKPNKISGMRQFTLVLKRILTRRLQSVIIFKCLACWSRVFILLVEKCSHILWVQLLAIMRYLRWRAPWDFSHSLMSAGAQCGWWRVMGCQGRQQQLRRLEELYPSQFVAAPEICQDSQWAARQALLVREAHGARTKWQF